jgi:hypothetical protein
VMCVCGISGAGENFQNPKNARNFLSGRRFQNPRGADGNSVAGEVSKTRRWLCWISVAGEIVDPKDVFA